MDIRDVRLKHRYDAKHYDDKTWAEIKSGATVGGFKVGFWTGPGRTGKDYWQVFFSFSGSTYTCKDNFSCFLTKSDVGGLVRIELTFSNMKVVPPRSSNCTVALTGGPNSWCPVEVVNNTGVDITAVKLKHRYDHDHFDEKNWLQIKKGETVGGFHVGFWTGPGRTGYDYWQIFFSWAGADYTCKDNFYCFLTINDVGGLVRIELTLLNMKVVPPRSSHCNVSLLVSGFPTANKADGFYNIAHMVNTQKAVAWAVGYGANGLEADLNFDSEGNPTVYKHGGLVSDCTCYLVPNKHHVCSVVSKDDATPAAALLRFIASQKGIALHIVDTKMTDGVNQAAAGIAVIKLLDSELFDAGYNGDVIVGVGETKYFPYIKAAAEQAAKSKYAARISFTFDGEGDNYPQVFSFLNLVGDRRAYGTGITVCSPATYYDAIQQGCVQEHRVAQGLTYIWTLDSESSMEKYLHLGARGILTNMPSVLGEVLRKNGLPLAKPSTRIPKAITPLTEASIAEPAAIPA
jgi:hypothetical protein